MASSVPVGLFDVFAKGSLNALLGFCVASLGGLQVGFELCDTVTLVLGQVKVTCLVDEVEAGALSSLLTVIEKVYRCSGISQSLATRQRCNTGDESGNNLQPNSLEGMTTRPAHQDGTCVRYCYVP